MSNDEIPTAGNFTVNEKDPSYEQIVTDTRHILTESKQYHQKHQKAVVAGREFVVNPKAFSPEYFNSSAICARNVPTDGSSFLEIGAGIGTVTITLLLEGKIDSAVATDINQSAVEALTKNAKKYGVSDYVDVRTGNVFNPIKQGEKFDTIFWNTPFGYVDEQENLSNLEKAAFDPGYASIKRFIAEAKNYLTTEGSAYFSFSSALGKPKKLQNIAKQAGVGLELAFETTVEQDFVVDYKIIEIA